MKRIIAVSALVPVGSFAAMLDAVAEAIADCCAFLAVCPFRP